MSKLEALRRIESLMRRAVKEAKESGLNHFVSFLAECADAVKETLQEQGEPLDSTSDYIADLEAQNARYRAELVTLKKERNLYCEAATNERNATSAWMGKFFASELARYKALEAMQRYADIDTPIREALAAQPANEVMETLRDIDQELEALVVGPSPIISGYTRVNRALTKLRALIGGAG